MKLSVSPFTVRSRRLKQSRERSQRYSILSSGLVDDTLKPRPFYHLIALHSSQSDSHSIFSTMEYVELGRNVTLTKSPFLISLSAYITS